MTICPTCYRKFAFIDKKRTIDEIELRVLFEYDEQMKNTVYQFKANYDYELRTTFLEYLKNDLKFYYRNYVIVPAPSAKEGNEKRGFNHVQSVFSILGLPMVPLIEKTANIEQKDLSVKERKNIKHILTIKDGNKLHGKNVLIVDDVITTGSTIKAMINLIKPYNPRKIKVLVLSGKSLNREKKKHR